ncbi:MAG: glycosyltransferase [Acidobacteria bacterium]|nr:glycosyltransferase [Acidobacteriota bacterium]
MVKFTVSVIIPNYNYGQYLSEAIQSVLNQTYACDEIIVVDDGSTDNSLEVLRSFGREVHVIQQPNRGVGEARNAGAARATGQLIAFLDADDYWHPTKIERQVELFENDEDLGLVMCGMEEFDSSGRIIGQYLNGRNGWCAQDFLRFEPVVSGPGSTSVIRKSVFDKVGGYDARKELHPSEDWELSYRIACEARLGFIPEVLVGYRNHGRNVHLEIPRMERAMLIAFDKIYANGPNTILVLRNTAYAKLYAVLAGSYFHAGDYSSFIRTMATSLRYSPKGIVGFLSYPLRVIKRKQWLTR